jgi:hypothetical protein
MKCSICGRDASYIKSIDKKIVNRIMQYGSELFAARCKDCLNKEEK